MDKTELLITMHRYSPSGNRRASIFINGKRFTYSKAIIYLKNNISDKSSFSISFNKHKLPWWVGDWKYGMNERKYIDCDKSSEKVFTENTKLFRRISRINTYITINK